MGGRGVKEGDYLVIGKRRQEVVSVQVFAGEHVREPHSLATAYRDPARAPALRAATDPPVAIGVVRCLHTGHGLLAAA